MQNIINTLNNYLIKWSLIVSLLTGLAACSSASQSEETPSIAKAAVSVTRVQKQPMESYLQLNGTSHYLRRETVQATTTGYLTFSKLVLGNRITDGEKVAVLQTKEAKALANLTIKDSLLKFDGNIPVVASQRGIIRQVYKTKGAYVQDGDSLASILIPSSLVFLLNVPYEEVGFVNPGKTCQIILPNSDTLQGTIADAVPQVNVSSQVEQFMVRVTQPQKNQVIPENLNVVIRFATTAIAEAQTLPRESIQTNETQTDFWVMKLINDTTAVKISIKKGIDNGQMVAIVSPKLNLQDRFLTVGAYGLPDTAFVRITDTQP